MFRGGKHTVHRKFFWVILCFAGESIRSKPPWGAKLPVGGFLKIGLPPSEYLLPDAIFRPLPPPPPPAAAPPPPLPPLPPPCVYTRHLRWPGGRELRYRSLQIGIYSSSRFRRAILPAAPPDGELFLKLYPSLVDEAFHHRPSPPPPSSSSSPAPRDSELCLPLQLPLVISSPSSLLLLLPLPVSLPSLNDGASVRGASQNVGKILSCV